MCATKSPRLNLLDSDIVAIMMTKMILRCRQTTLRSDLKNMSEELMQLEMQARGVRHKLCSAVNASAQTFQFSNNDLKQLETDIHHFESVLNQTSLKLFKCRCDGCPKRFSSNSDMDKHFRRMHTDETVVYCDFEKCSKKLRSRPELKIHMRTHTGDRFVCDQCSKAFTHNSNFRNHLRLHTGEKPFACRHRGCGKPFARLADCQGHEILHTGVKPFVCSHSGCGKAFSARGTLRVHLRVHTGEKPFLCNVRDCRRTFSTATGLVYHNRVSHTGEKPFKCKHEECEVTFASSSHRTIHHVSHTTDKPFVCEHCRKQYKYLYNLRVHKKTCSDLN